MTKRQDPEHKQQCAFFDIVRAYANQDSRYKDVFAIPNGGKRDKVTAWKMKAEGVEAGVLDIFVSRPSGALPGMWIEFKAGRNKLTAEQAAFADRMTKNGYPVIVARQALQAFRALKIYFNNPKFFEQELHSLAQERENEDDERER